jgi:hypothetical protein
MVPIGNLGVEVGGGVVLVALGWIRVTVDGTAVGAMGVAAGPHAPIRVIKMNRKNSLANGLSMDFLLRLVAKHTPKLDRNLQYRAADAVSYGASTTHRNPM